MFIGSVHLSDLNGFLRAKEEAERLKTARATFAAPRASGAKVLRSIEPQAIYRELREARGTAA
ncbi:MAG: hypothetical protein AAFV51_09510 [Pseudomonadota bacterium]